MIERRWYSLARHAMLDALRLVRPAGGGTVLLPTFICRDVVGAVRAAGMREAWYEVTADLAPVALPAARHDVVVAVNYFGIAQDLAPFAAWATSHGAVVLEDNAHGWLSRDPSGAVLGERAALGVTSVRKTIPSPDGALLCVADPGLARGLGAAPAARGGATPVGWRVRRAVGAAQRATRLPVFDAMQSAARLARRLRTGSALPTAGDEAEAAVPGPAAPHARSLAMAGAVDSVGESRRRRELWVRAASETGRLGLRPVYATLPPGAVPYGYPVRARDAQLGALRRAARATGATLMRWPELPSAVRDGAPAHHRDVWLLNFTTWTSR